MGASATILFPLTRRRVLALLYGQPTRRFYQRQIITTVGLGSGTVQRELQQLTQADLLQRTQEGRQTYFQANPSSPIFEELRGIVRKTVGVPHLLREALTKLEHRINAAFVYGSVAAGTDNAASDIDLMILGDVSLTQVLAALTNTQRDLAREVNPTIYPIPEFCRKLSERQHFILQVMAGPKLFLFGDEQQLKDLAQQRLAQGAHHQPRRDRQPSRRRRP